MNKYNTFLEDEGDDSPSVVPAAKLIPMAAGQVFPALVKLLSFTSIFVISTNLCLYSTSPAKFWFYSLLKPRSFLMHVCKLCYF